MQARQGDSHLYSLLPLAPATYIALLPLALVTYIALLSLALATYIALLSLALVQKRWLSGAYTNLSSLQVGTGAGGG